MEYKLPEVIGATIAVVISVISAAAAALKKLNILRFGKAEKKEVATVTTVKEICPSHEKIVGELIKIHDQQVKNGELHKQHLEDLESGRKEFKEIKECLRVIGESVAVLLDRTGGRPKGL